MNITIEWDQALKAPAATRNDIRLPGLNFVGAIEVPPDGFPTWEELVAAALVAIEHVIRACHAEGCMRPSIQHRMVEAIDAAVLAAAPGGKGYGTESDSLARMAITQAYIAKHRVVTRGFSGDKRVADSCWMPLE